MPDLRGAPPAVPGMRPGGPGGDPVWALAVRVGAPRREVSGVWGEPGDGAEARKSPAPLKASGPAQ